jgi:hypothetical protein
VHIADVAGGPWPEKARAAAAAIFKIAETSPQVKMLADVRAIFRLKGDPEYIATADLLAELRKMDNRPWSNWGPRSGCSLSLLLKQFEIQSRRVHPMAGVDFRSYFAKDFQDAWERYLVPASAAAEPEELVPAPAMGGAVLPHSPSSSPQISAIGAD